MLFKRIIILSHFIVAVFFFNCTNSEAQTHKNEFITGLNLVRGGFDPYNFFDGYALNVVYNREILPYVLVHTNFNASQLSDIKGTLGPENEPSLRHHNSIYILDAGPEIIPIEIKNFQLRFTFSGSFQYRYTSDGMNPERLSTSSGREGKNQFYNYTSSHWGYKFEIKPTFLIQDNYLVSLKTSMRSFPTGTYYIPNSFELGLQGGIKF